MQITKFPHIESSSCTQFWVIWSSNIVGALEIDSSKVTSKNLMIHIHLFSFSSFYSWLLSLLLAPAINVASWLPFSLMPVSYYFPSDSLTHWSWSHAIMWIRFSLQSLHINHSLRINHGIYSLINFLLPYLHDGWILLVTINIVL